MSTINYITLCAKEKEQKREGGGLLQAAHTASRCQQSRNIHTYTTCPSLHHHKYTKLYLLLIKAPFHRATHILSCSSYAILRQQLKGTYPGTKSIPTFKVRPLKWVRSWRHNHSSSSISSCLSLTCIALLLMWQIAGAKSKHYI